MTKAMCPRFADAPELARAEYENEAPTCLGRWLRGSGGHRVHSLDCGREATWWHPLDMHAYCDEHVPPKDREWFGMSWELYPTGDIASCTLKDEEHP